MEESNKQPDPSSTKKRTISKVNNSSTPSEEEQQTKKLKSPPCSKVNQYSGWLVPKRGYDIPKIKLENLTKETFYNEYVKQRRPVVLEGKLDDLNGLKLWQNDNKHLRKMAGKEKVMVEVRSKSTESFGRGNEIPMTFAQFLDLVEAGDDNHYLTTQDVEANEDGQPDLMAPFMKTLKDDFPLRPDIAGNLIPQNINLWMGNNSGDGVSSGLHHDYHDNLYIILRGRKRFRLYSPKDTENLYPRGSLLQIHPNGRINYEGEETTAFGADLQSDLAAKASKAQEIAEQRLIEAEKALEEGRSGAEKEVEIAEKMLEEAMDALIDIETENNEDECDDVNLDENLVEEEDANEEMKQESGGNDDDEDDEEEYGGFNRLVDKTVKDPDNFSQISVRDLSNIENLQKGYPRFEKATAAFCDLSIGQMLYLPASWWHEVKSFGTQEGHLAMNYWFHPPDSGNFLAPYTSDFWQNDFDSRFEVAKTFDNN